MKILLIATNWCSFGLALFKWKCPLSVRRESKLNEDRAWGFRRLGGFRREVLCFQMSIISSSRNSRTHMSKNEHWKVQKKNLLERSEVQTYSNSTIKQNEMFHSAILFIKQYLKDKYIIQTFTFLLELLNNEGGKTEICSWLVVHKAGWTMLLIKEEADDHTLMKELWAGDHSFARHWAWALHQKCNLRHRKPNDFNEPGRGELCLELYC